MAVAARASWNTVGAVPSAEAGWTQVGELFGGNAGGAVDNHRSHAAADVVELTGSESGSVNFDIAGTVDGAVGVMLRYVKGAGQSWDVVQGTSGDDATHGANASVTGSGNLDLQPGDVVVAVKAAGTDAALTITSPAITAVGITFNATTQRTSGAGSTAGQDGNVEVFDAEVASGSGTVAPTLAFTTATSQSGPAVFLRLRALTTSTPVSGSDSAAATETSSLAAGLSSTETGVGAEGSTLAAGLSAADSAAATQAQSLTAALAGTDSAAATEAAQIAVQITSADSATATESAALSAQRSASDAATATEGASLAAGLSSADSAAGTEAATVDAGTAKSSADSATATESATVQVILTSTDGATASEVAALAAQIASTDLATALEGATVDTSGPIVVPVVDIRIWDGGPDAKPRRVPLPALQTSAPAEDRSILVAATNRMVAFGEESVVRFKDPSGVIDYHFLWDEWLDPTEPIATAAVSISPADGSLLQTNLVHDGTTVTVRIAGGTVGRTYEVTNHVVTTGGEEQDKTFRLRVRPL